MAVWWMRSARRSHRMAKRSAPAGPRKLSARASMAAGSVAGRAASSARAASSVARAPAVASRQARPGAPWAISASLCASPAATPDRSASQTAVRSTVGGPNFSVRQRERMVGNCAPGRWQTRRMIPRSGGSSRVLRTALAPLGLRSSAVSMIATRQGAAAGVLAKNSGSSRASSTGIDLRDLPSSESRCRTSRSGWALPATRRLTVSSGAAPRSPYAGAAAAPSNRRAAR